MRIDIMNCICLNVCADLSGKTQIRHERSARKPIGMGTLFRLGTSHFSQEFRLIDFPKSIHNNGLFSLSADNRVYRERAEKFRLEMQEASNGVDILGAALNALAVVSSDAQRHVQASYAGGYRLASSVLDNEGNRVVYSHRNPEYCNLYLWTLNGSWQARLNHKIAENVLCIISASKDERYASTCKKPQNPLTWVRGCFNLNFTQSSLCK